MRKNKISILLFIAILLQIYEVNSVDITLSSSMEDTTADSYTISSKIVTLTSSEEYTITGTCSECGIVVEKEISPTITLNSITIDNSETGPFVIKKNANVKLVIEGISTITDNDSDEAAGIKFKSSSSLTISGSGTLVVLGNIKNDIKGASLSNLIINSGTFNVTCVNNAIAADGSVTINGGRFNIKTSEGDGIKSDPDYDDTDSEGSVIITSGTFNINSYSDGIQAKAKLIISGGTFNIITFNDGSSAENFDKDLYSAKGIKVSTYLTSEISMIISEGTFNLDTADDSVHSDGNITITGGTFKISSGDDGIHADNYLILGKSGDSNSLVNINITKSYEGLEGAQIYIYSGTYNVIASDDGINSAGDTTEDCDGNNNQPGGNNFGPPNNQGIRQGKNLRRNLKGRKLQSECSSFHLYILGGNVYVNAEADGLDANGNIVISGGDIEVWGAKSGSDGDFVDYDGTLTINRGTFFAGGNAGMVMPSNFVNSQGKIYGSNSVTSNYYVNIMSGSTTIKSYKAPKNIAYLYYTSSSVDSSYKFSISSSSTSTNNGETETDNSNADTSTQTNGNNEDNDTNSDYFDTFTTKGKFLKINMFFSLIISIFALNF